MSKEAKIYVLVWFWLGLGLWFGESLSVGFVVWAIGASAGWFLGPTLRTLRYVGASALTVLTLVLLVVLVVKLQDRSRLYTVDLGDGNVVDIEAARPQDAEAAADAILDGRLQPGPSGVYRARRTDNVNLQRVASGAAVLGFIAAVLWHPIFFGRLGKAWLAGGQQFAPQTRWTTTTVRIPPEVNAEGLRHRQIKIAVPQLPDHSGMTIVRRWRKKEGDPVIGGEILVELASYPSDGSTLRIASPIDGTLTRIVAAEGQFRSFGSVLGMVEETADESRH